LDLPTRPGEAFMCDYLLQVEGELYLLAVDGQTPGTAVVLRTSRPPAPHARSAQEDPR
jgi:hypothetical protein